LSTFFFANARNKIANYIHIPEMGFQSLFQGYSILLLARDDADERGKIRLPVVRFCN
jgi:hypothetical protein